MCRRWKQMQSTIIFSIWDKPIRITKLTLWEGNCFHLFRTRKFTMRKSYRWSRNSLPSYPLWTMCECMLRNILLKRKMIRKISWRSIGWDWCCLKITKSKNKGKLLKRRARRRFRGRFLKRIGINERWGTRRDFRRKRLEKQKRDLNFKKVLRKRRKGQREGGNNFYKNLNKGLYQIRGSQLVQISPQSPNMKVRIKVKYQVFRSTAVTASTVNKADRASKRSWTKAKGQDLTKDFPSPKLKGTSKYTRIHSDLESQETNQRWKMIKRRKRNRLRRSRRSR